MMNENEFKKAPVYLQIRESIYNKIISGEYKSGDQLPAEDKLAEQYGVSRMTVNKALMELVNREYLTRIQGSGTYVSKMRKEGSRAKGMSFNDSLTKKGFKVKTTVLEKKMIVPSKEVAELLNVPITSQVLYLKRLRKVHEDPIVVQETYLTSKVSDMLFGIDFTQQSLYASLKKYCNSEIVKAKDTVEAKSACGEVCDLLEVNEGFPVLMSQRLAFASNEVPIELSYSIYRSDQYVLEVEYT
ncbi:MAG: GntR family transcriptional regulator [Hespellia sp.]|nr:GntR family transcriptional regulator [Hespellia sp.]